MGQEGGWLVWGTYLGDACSQEGRLTHKRPSSRNIDGVPKRGCLDYFSKVPTNRGAGKTNSRGRRETLSQMLGANSRFARSKKKKGDSLPAPSSRRSTHEKKGIDVIQS